MRGVAAVLACLLAASHASAAQTPTASPAPLRLREAILEALRSSPALSGALDSVETAKIQNRLAQSRFGLKIVPNVNAGTAPAGLGQRGFGFDLVKRLPFGAEISTSVSSMSYGTGESALRDAGYTIGVTQPLFRGAGAAATFDLKNAQRSVVASERNIAEAKHQLIVTAADRFFAVLRQQRLVRASERALERAATLRQASEARARVGLATEFDVLRADLLASQASVTMAAQREALENALEELNLLLGRPPAQPLDVADEDLSDEGLAAQGLRPLEGDATNGVERFVRDAIGARSDVREAYDKVADARRALSMSHWNLLPQVNVNASFTERGLGPSATPAFAQFMNGWRVGLTTNYALDRSEQVAAAGTASVSLRAAERAALESERRVEADVRRAYRAWTHSRETIEAQRKAVELAGKQLRLAQLRLDLGLASSLDLVEAENNLYQAQSARIGAEVDRALAGLVLEHAAGTLDPERFQP